MRAGYRMRKNKVFGSYLSKNLDILSFELDTSVIEKFVLRIFLFDSIILITVDGDVANTIIPSSL
ncbi:MAG: hypothetical protein CM15mP104_3180 [Gammaproteobacteria bacterium]|nr:MAG: hypothetical protein CM15mP104_3180 [Gammaproteobacteria bacterium]